MKSSHCLGILVNMEYFASWLDNGMSLCLANVYWHCQSPAFRFVACCGCAVLKFV